MCRSKLSVSIPDARARARRDSFSRQCFCRWGFCGMGLFSIGTFIIGRAARDRGRSGRQWTYRPVARPLPNHCESTDTAAADKKAYPELDEARQMFAKQDVDGALDAFNAAAKAHADLPNGRILLATIYFTVNRPREARPVGKGGH